MKRIIFRWTMAVILLAMVLASPTATFAANPGNPTQVTSLSRYDCTYSVRHGDSLSRIAVRYNMTAYALASANSLHNINLIYAGMTLRVPCAGTSNPPGQGDGSLPSGICSYYAVRPGDNLRLIAARLGTTWQAIAQVNRLYNPNVIYTGMRLAIPCGSGSNGNPGQWKTYTSTKHHYVVNYPANWTISVQTPGYGGDPEYVYLRPAATSLPVIEVYALKGAPPITGFENCNKNLIFKGIPACNLSLPKGQGPAQHLLVFQKGDSHYQIAIQYEAQQQLAVFEEVVKSFRFTQ
jgi:LysM repeat protein